MPYQFKPSWLLNSFFIVFILGFFSLGIWQLDRANEKQSLQSMIDQRSQLTPLSLNMPFEEFAPYQIVQATGQYLMKDSILIAGMNHQNEQGFYLITPFEIMASRSVIMVNRGWLPQEKNPVSFPKFKTPRDVLTIEGHLNHPELKPISQARSTNALSATPPLWNYLDIDFFSQLHGYSVLPLVLKLKMNGQTRTIASTPVPREETELSLVKDWPKYDSKHNEHTNYASLWFIFSLLGLFTYIAISFKKNKTQA